MRIDKKGELHTLEEDIEYIWAGHGMKVEREEVKTEDGFDVWKIFVKPRTVI